MNRLNRVLLLAAFMCSMPEAWGLPVALPADEAVRQSGAGPSAAPGPLVICGGGALPDAVFEEIRRLSGRPMPRLVVIPTASRNADREDYADGAIALWKRRGFSAVVLHTRDRDTADRVGFADPLQSADAIWFGGGSQSRIADAYLDTDFEEAVYAFHRQGGVIGGTSAGAAIMSRLMIASGNPRPVVRRGLDLVPRGVIDQHFRQRKRRPRLRFVIQRNPGHVGAGIDEGTALVLERRRARVIGRSLVTIIQAAEGDSALTEEVWKPGTEHVWPAADRPARTEAGASHPDAPEEGQR